MMHSHDCQYTHRNSARDRKATKRRDRRLREKRKRPRHNLQQDRMRAHSLGKWTISKYGAFGNLFEEICDQMRSHLLTRKKIDQDRKRSAIRSLADIYELQIERLCKRGVIVTWSNPDSETFQVHMREQDCLSIDDHQWRLKRSPEDNELIGLVQAAYEGIHRTQIEQLLDKGQVVFESSRLGKIRIYQMGGVLHTKYINTEPAVVEQQENDFAMVA